MLVIKKHNPKFPLQCLHYSLYLVECSPLKTTVFTINIILTIEFPYLNLFKKDNQKMHQRAIQFSRQQKSHALIFLSFFHIFIIAISNYLVQISFPITLPLGALGLEDFTFHITWGTFTFPFIFLATDLTVRIFGASLARKIIFAVMFPALIVSYLISTVFANASFQGISALSIFNLFVFRIAIASFLAYLVGQLLDVSVFNQLRQLKTWWIAPCCSMIFGSMADTYVFFATAFYQCEDPFLAENWFSLGVVDYCFKLFVGIILFVPAYGVLLNYILQHLQNFSRRLG